MTIYTDGSALKNPIGNAACRIIVDKEDGTDRIVVTRQLGFHSNNYAEIQGILLACAWVQSNTEPVDKITIFSDSRVALGWILKDPGTKVAERSDIMTTIETIRLFKKIWEENKIHVIFLHWGTKELGEIPADFGNK